MEDAMQFYIRKSHDYHYHQWLFVVYIDSFVMTPVGSETAVLTSNCPNLGVPLQSNCSQLFPIALCSQRKCPLPFDCPHTKTLLSWTISGMCLGWADVPYWSAGHGFAVHIALREGAGDQAKGHGVQVQQGSPMQHLSTTSFVLCYMCFDFCSYFRYVHRVGRTARMGQQGRALLFLLPSEGEYVARLKQHGVQVQQGNLMQHLSYLQTPADTAPVQVRLLHQLCPFIAVPSRPISCHTCFTQIAFILLTSLIVHSFHGFWFVRSCIFFSIVTCMHLSRLQCLVDSAPLQVSLLHHIVFSFQSHAHTLPSLALIPLYLLNPLFLHSHDAYGFIH